MFTNNNLCNSTLIKTQNELWNCFYFITFNYKSKNHFFPVIKLSFKILVKVHIKQVS